MSSVLLVCLSETITHMQYNQYVHEYIKKNSYCQSYLFYLPPSLVSCKRNWHISTGLQGATQLTICPCKKTRWLITTQKQEPSPPRFLSSSSLIHQSGIKFTARSHLRYLLRHVCKVRLCFSVSGGLVYEFEKSAVVRLDRPWHILSTLLPAGSGGWKASVHWSAPLRTHMHRAHSSA